MSGKRIFYAALSLLLLLLPACNTVSGGTASFPQDTAIAFRTPGRIYPMILKAAPDILFAQSYKIISPRAVSAPPVTAKMPAASGKDVFTKQGATLDYSNTSEGYIMAKYSGSAKIKVLVYFNGGASYYQYNLEGNDVFITIPLQSGSGSYRVRFMENVSGSNYAELCSTELNATVSGYGGFLYPNQYVNYSLTSAAVATAKSLCANCSSNTEKTAAIYKYITANIKYDYAKAGSVTSGYLPNVDSTLSVKKGICFDYSALMAAMCRSQGIPVKLIMGSTKVGYHAWNEVYLDGWKRYDTTFAAAGQSAGTYTAEKNY